MSLTFLFRLISNLTSSKLVADEKLLSQCRMPLDFPEHVSFQMISFYGVKSLATRYMQEMFTTLTHKRKKHPRISLFARALHVFPDYSLRSEAFLALVQYLGHLLHLLESERLLTRTTSVVFFQAYSQVCTIYLQGNYVLRAVQLMHQHEPAMMNDVLNFAVEFLTNNALPDEAACQAAAKGGGGLTHKAVVFGASSHTFTIGDINASYVDGDLFLASLATFYQDRIENNQKRLDAAFGKYDIDGDGQLSLSEFKAMLSEIHQGEVDDVENLYHTLIAMGEGTVQLEDLTQMLHIKTTREHAAATEHHSLELATMGNPELDLAAITKDMDFAAAHPEAPEPASALEMAPTATSYHAAVPNVAVKPQTITPFGRAMSQKNTPREMEPTVYEEAKRGPVIGGTNVGVGQLMGM